MWMGKEGRRKGGREQSTHIHQAATRAGGIFAAQASCLALKWRNSMSFLCGARNRISLVATTKFNGNVKMPFEGMFERTFNRMFERDFKRDSKRFFEGYLEQTNEGQFKRKLKESTQK